MTDGKRNSNMEKRAHPRIEFSKPSKCDDVDCEILDISAGGACIMTEKPLVRGRVVILMCPFQGTDILLPSFAVVKWMYPAKDRFKMGMQFLK
jgi:hypothetical protein